MTRALERWLSLFLVLCNPALGQTRSPTEQEPCGYLLDLLDRAWEAAGRRRAGVGDFTSLTPTFFFEEEHYEFPSQYLFLG